MLEEFLLSRSDGRCLYYLSEKETYDPQLISGYLASLTIFMRTHHNKVPKAIVMDDGVWVFTHDPHGGFFIAASISSVSVIDISYIQDVLTDILQSLLIITGNQSIPFLRDEKAIRDIIDQTIKNTLVRIRGLTNLDNYKPGILGSDVPV